MKENINFNIEEKIIDDILFAGHKYTGRYDQIGKAFSTTGKHCGRFISRKPTGLYYNGQYKEKDADIEGGFPVKADCLKKDFSEKKISCRTLPGGMAVTLIHLGPYEIIGKSYQRIIDYIKTKNHTTKIPTREVYHKGSGMIFKGNPEKYITEIQFLIE